MAADPTITRFGEAALLVELRSTERVHALDRSLRDDVPDGIVTLVPGLDTLLVEYDPLRIEASTLRTMLRERAATVRVDREAARLRTIPVIYGGEDGPDLEEVGRLTRLTTREVIAAHTGAELRVRILGFAPGFAYLGPLPAALHVPRLATPRTGTPAGSVAIAGELSGIYPAQLPGGWRVIGRTLVAVFDPRRSPPSYLAPGDVVRFEAVERSELEGRAGVPEDW